MIVDHHLHALRKGAPMPEGFRRFLEQSVEGDLQGFLERYDGPAALESLLDEAGVDYAVILAEVAPITSHDVPNEYVGAFCAGRPRFLPFASVNPYVVAQPAAYFKQLVTNLGCRGVKLYPTYQYFYPNDPILYPLYGVCEEAQLPVMVHTGSSVFPGSRLKYGSPMALDDVAVDFPNLSILLSHCGRPFWYDEAFALARLHDNVYLEIGGLPPQYLLRYFPELERLERQVGTKIIFGSDWPGIRSIQQNIDTIRQLPLSDATKDSILGGTAARLHRLGPRQTP